MGLGRLPTRCRCSTRSGGRRLCCSCCSGPGSRRRCGGLRCCRSTGAPGRGSCLCRCGDGKCAGCQSDGCQTCRDDRAPSHFIPIGRRCLSTAVHRAVLSDSFHGRLAGFVLGRKGSGMRFHHDREPAGDLTFSDVFLVPNRSKVASRLDVDLATADGTGASIPVVAANMTAVSGRRMAETIARCGGLAVIPQDIPVDVVADVVAWIKERDPVHDTALTLPPTGTVGEALNLLPKRDHGAVIVVDQAAAGRCGDRGRLLRRRSVHPAGRDHVPRAADASAGHRPRDCVRPAARRPAPARAGRRHGRPDRRHPDPRARSPRDAVRTGPRCRRQAPRRRRDRDQRRRRAEGEIVAGRRRGRPRDRHRTRSPGTDARSGRTRSRPRPAGADRGRERRHRRRCQRTW